ncbi:MAG: SPOR domain-containing protein [Acidobacteria bacterium]|nr:SPOR domain-containing protein [Acidobacteriota bacterium]
MPEPNEGADSRPQDNPEASMEVQLGGRHLTMAVAGLALFGLVLFLLGRWSERLGRTESQPAAAVATGSGAAAPTGSPDPAAPPKDLTFYETLGKRGTPGLQETGKSAASRREAPAELPAAPSPPPGPVSATKAESTGSVPKAPGQDGDRYRVQVASTRDLASARLLVDRLRKKGYAASIDTAQGSEGQTQYKVRIGNYSEREPAEKVAQRVREEEKVGAWIVKVQG